PRRPQKHCPASHRRATDRTPNDATCAHTGRALARLAAGPADYDLTVGGDSVPGVGNRRVPTPTAGHPTGHAVLGVDEVVAGARLHALDIGRDGVAFPRFAVVRHAVKRGDAHLSPAAGVVRRVGAE